MDRTTLRLFGLVLLTFASTFASLGCGGTVEAGTGGSGGAGGTGAAGGAGGAGAAGGAEGACSPEEKAAAYDQLPKLGLLSPPPGGPMTAVIASVTESSLEYTLGPGGTLDKLVWRGPSLLDVFKQGDTVTVGVADGWHYVMAGSTIAATYTTYDFVPPAALPAVPMSKVPPLGFAAQCSFPESGGACGQPPSDVHVLAVQVGTGSEAALVPVGDTLASGDLRVHNALSAALPGYGSNDCVLEALFMTGVTVLAPVGK